MDFDPISGLPMDPNTGLPIDPDPFNIPGLPPPLPPRRRPRARMPPPLPPAPAAPALPPALGNVPSNALSVSRRRARISAAAMDTAINEIVGDDAADIAAHFDQLVAPAAPVGPAQPRPGRPRGRPRKPTHLLKRPRRVPGRAAHRPRIFPEGSAPGRRRDREFGRRARLGLRNRRGEGVSRAPRRSGRIREVIEDPDRIRLVEGIRFSFEGGVNQVPLPVPRRARPRQNGRYDPLRPHLTFRRYGVVHMRAMAHMDAPRVGGLYFDEERRKWRLGPGGSREFLTVQMRVSRPWNGRRIQWTYNQRIAVDVPHGSILTEEMIQYGFRRWMLSVDDANDYDEYIFEVLSIGNRHGVPIDINSPSALRTLPLRGVTTKIVDCSVGTDEGLCVIAALQTALGKTTIRNLVRDKDLLIRQFRSCLDGWKPSDGISLEHLGVWCRLYCQNKLNIYAVEPLCADIFWKCTTPGAHHSVLIKVTGAHADVVVDPTTKRQAIHGNIQLTEMTWGPEYYSDFEAIDVESLGLELLIEKISDPNAKGFVLYNYSGQVADRLLLSKIIAEVMKVTGKHPSHTLCNDIGVKAFVHPTTNATIIYDPDYGDINSMLDDCRNSDLDLPSVCTVYKQQAASVIAKTTVETIVGQCPTSLMSPGLYKLFKTVKGGAFYFSDQAGDGSNVMDINKAYSYALLNDPSPIPIYNPLDDVVDFSRSLLKPGDAPAHESLPAGFGIIPIDIQLPFWPRPLSRVLYAVSEVAFLLQYGYIQLSDITHWLVPSSVLPADTYVSTVHRLYNSLPEKTAKLICNMTTGFFGKDHTTKAYSCVVDSAEVAAAVHGYHHSHPETGTIHVLPVGSFFEILLTREKHLYKNCMPLYQRIVSYTRVQMLNYARIGYDSGLGVPIMSKVDCLGWNTDPYAAMLPYTDPKEPGMLNQKQTSPWKEMAPKSVATAAEISEKCLVPLVNPEWLDREDFHRGALYRGPSGSGKSTKAVEIFKFNKDNNKKVLAFTMTGTSRNNMELLGIESPRTWAWIKEIMGHIQRRIVAYLASFDVIIGDEYSQFAIDVYVCLLLAKRQNPELIINLFGDVNQCRPYQKTNKSSVYNYDQCILLHYLCDGVRHDLQFIEGCGRYDMPLFQVSQTLLEEGILAGFRLRMAPPTCKRAIVKTNARKRSWDKVQMNKHMSEVDLVYRPYTLVYNPAPDTTPEAQKQDITLFSGLWVVCRVNYKAGDVPVTNGDRLLVGSWDEEQKTVYLQPRTVSSVYPDGFEVSFDAFMKHFELDYAVTSYRAQSVTEEGQLAVLEATYMTKNELYVAITRPRALKQLFVQPDVRLQGQFFRPEQYPKYIKVVEPYFVHAAIAAIKWMALPCMYLFALVLGADAGVQEQLEKEKERLLDPLNPVKGAERLRQYAEDQKQDPYVEIVQEARWPSWIMMMNELDYYIKTTDTDNCLNIIPDEKTDSQTQPAHKAVHLVSTKYLPTMRIGPSDGTIIMKVYTPVLTDKGKPTRKQINRSPTRMAQAITDFRALIAEYYKDTPISDPNWVRNQIISALTNPHWLECRYRQSADLKDWEHLLPPLVS